METKTQYGISIASLCAQRIFAALCCVGLIGLLMTACSRAPHASTEELLGATDIQSLADLGNSYAVVREMRPVPFGLDDIARLAAATAAPLAPLLLTIFPAEELLLRIIKLLF